MMFFQIFTLILAFAAIPISLHFLLLNLHLHLHGACFVNIFDLFFPVIMLKMLRFKSSALFRTHTH